MPRGHALAQGVALLVCTAVALVHWSSPAHNAEGASLIEVVADDDSSVLSLQALDAVHREGRTHRGVWVFVVDEQAGALLLLRRSSHMKTCPGTWSIVGEHNQPGESYEAAARRGVAEELGWSSAQVARMQLTLLGPTTFFRHTYPGGGRTDRQHSAYALLRLPGGASSPRVAPDREEASAQSWAPLNTLAAERRMSSANRSSKARAARGAGGGLNSQDALRLPARPSTTFFARFTGR